jgi:ribulose-phosphate 3-epimerase
MIERPEATLPRYLDAGANWVSVHVEATHHLQRCLDLIRRRGARAGAVLNPATPVDALEACWADLDYAVVMSVNPGWGGQPFLPGSVPKVRRVRDRAAAAGQKVPIEVDGGVVADNVGVLVGAGAEILVAGTAIYGEADTRQAIERLRNAGSGRSSGLIGRDGWECGASSGRWDAPFLRLFSSHPPAPRAAA